MDQTRRCGFLEREQRGEAHVVWARGNVSTDECPKSYISADSLYYLERFAVWRAFGNSQTDELPAKEAEALIILESQWKAEKQNAQR